MNGPEIVVVRTGSANLASVVVGLERLGARPVLSEDASLVREAPMVVLPGVGSFGPAMRYLRARGLDGAVSERVRMARPVLAVCLGMQLLCDGSDESPGTAGLGLAPGCLHRFDPPARVPQMGWNLVTPGPGSGLVRPAAMYFANSYRLDTVPEGWAGSTTEYGRPFVSALERGPILGCQFHPELSGAAGLELIGRWIALARVSEGAAC